jgi:photosystem II stability/assembly factor-like uncharacterized protein
VQRRKGEVLEVMRKIFLLLLGIIMCNVVIAQWKPQESGTKARFRGVSAISRTVAWASGNNGTCARTTDGGKSWHAQIVSGAAALDFRDIHAVDSNTAYLLSIGKGDMSRIYKTTDGGRNWDLQFMNTDPDAFFDAFAFWDPNNGIAFSDPVRGRFVIITTTDGGVTWKPVSEEKIPPALPGESAFAASGTCITVQGKNNVWIGTGGAAARVFRSTDRGRTWSVATTPIISGSDSTGIFSLAFKDQRNGVAVGGDYKNPAETGNNLAITRDGGRTWTAVEGSKLPGYRSCVVFVPGTAVPALVAVGPTGSDYSIDLGKKWMSLDKTGYHSVSFAGPADAGWAVGEDGLIARFEGSMNSRRSKIR